MFSFLISTFDAVLYRPLFNALIFFYEYLPGRDFGVAIIFLTIVIRLILYPLSIKAIHSQRMLQSLQPKLDEIQKKHKGDKEKQAMATLELYRSEKINPFSGIFLLLIQLPVLIALYQVFSRGLKPEELQILYSFIKNPQHVNAVFLGMVDLSKSNIVFAVLAGFIQFFQTKMLLPAAEKKEEKKKEKDIASIMQKQMLYFFPFITVVILLKLPAALGLYWMASGLFSIIQQYVILKRMPSAKKDATEAKIISTNTREKQ